MAIFLIPISRYIFLPFGLLYLPQILFYYKIRPFQVDPFRFFLNKEIHLQHILFEHQMPAKIWLRIYRVYSVNIA